MRLSVLVLGALAITAQTAFLREILATFRAGELTIGAALLFWLLWTATGSGIIGRFAARTESPSRRFHALLPWYGILGYLGVIAIANVPYIARLTPGELVPFDVQFLAIGLAFLPFNVLGGILFTLGVKALEKKDTPFAGETFALEAFGSALAGAVISLLLVSIFSNHIIALLCPLGAFACASAWSVRRKRMGGLITSAILLALLPAALLANTRASAYMYKGQQLLRIKDTKYGRLRVTKRDEMKTFYSDAAFLFSTPDPETSEYTVHIPMLASMRRKNVLVLGGGPGGVIEEVLKYDTVEKITCVEIDPYLFKLADRYLDEDWDRDKRVKTVFADGRAFLEQTNDSFDVIIMTMPSPLSGVTNRYYTREFFMLASSHLSQDGVLGFSLTGAENFIPDDLAHFLASIRATLRTAFPSVAVLPGVQCRFLACKKEGAFDSLGWEDISLRRIESGIETAYVRDYFIRYTMSRARMDFIREALNSADDPFINADNRPIGFFSRTLLQGNLDGSRTLRHIEKLSDSRILLALMAALLISAFGFTLIPGKGVLRRSIIVTITSVGLTEISLEVLAIMAYQSIFGFLYGRIALLTGSYMAGLALGAWGATRRVEQKKAEKTHLIKVQCFIAVIPVLWIVLLKFHSAFPDSRVMIEAAFYLLTVLAGLAGGFQFPVADALYRSSAVRDNPNAGAIYGMDLAGSSIGALITASLMIPVLGMTTVLVFLAALNILIAGALLLRGRQ